MSASSLRPAGGDRHLPCAPHPRPARSQLGSTISELGKRSPTTTTSCATRAGPRRAPRATPLRPTPAGRVDRRPTRSAASRRRRRRPRPAQSRGDNYLITIPPAGGTIQVYNAVYGPDNGSRPGLVPASTRAAGTSATTTPRSPLALVGPCNANTQTTNHEEDGAHLPAPLSFQHLGVINPLPRQQPTSSAARTPSSTSSRCCPSDAPTGMANTLQYTEMYDALGTKITRPYDAAGNRGPTCLTYHNWIDVATYSGAGDGGTVRWSAGYGPQAPLQAARRDLPLRVAASNNTGANGSAEPPGGNWARPTRATRCASSTTSEPPAQPARSGLERHDAVHPHRRLLRLLPDLRLPDRARLRRTDGDPRHLRHRESPPARSTCTWSTPAVPWPGRQRPATVAVNDLGSSRSTPSGSGNVVNPPLSDPTQAFAEPTTGGVKHYGRPLAALRGAIPTNYNPGANPNNWWWSMKYLITPAGTANDTFALRDRPEGNPAHLLIS